MRSAFPGLFLAAALAGLANVAPPAAPAAERPDDKLVEKVNKSIERGKKYLRGQMVESQGNWERNLNALIRPGGPTGLVLLALLTAGVEPTDRDVQRGLKYLRELPPKNTYVVSLQTMVFAMAGEAVDRERIQRNVDWLLKTRLPNGWSYGPDEERFGQDFSNTQYALLGLHAGIESGFARVPRKELKAIQKIYLDSQYEGGWPYRLDRRSDATFTMTTAGLCGLLITGMDLATGKQVLDEATGKAKNCGQYDENKAVARALRWVSDRFPAELTPEIARIRLRHPFYALYGIERAGRLTGQRFFGGHDWYEVGCRYLVSTQHPDGSWGASQGGQMQLDQWPVIATSFSLLFLAKGRTPVLLTKLAYGSRGNSGWNNKRNDARHLVEFASRELFDNKPLAWQVFDVRDHAPDKDEDYTRLAAQLLQSPILYINGHDFPYTGRDEQLLRKYLDNGGFIFAEACCGGRDGDRGHDFDQKFRRLMKDLFPDSPLERLKADHPIWDASGKFVVTPRDFPRLEGIQHGCKTVVIYSPDPVAGYWEANLHERGRGRKAFQLGANVIAYATGMELPRPRLTEVEIVQDSRNRRPEKRGFFRVAQLRHEGDWQPAPKAMRNLMHEASKVGLNVVLETTPVYPSSEAVYDYRFLYMHGRNEFSEERANLDRLRFNLENGGTLLADACCGSKTFDRSFRRFMEVLWAKDKLKLEPIPLDDELYSKALNGTAIQAVRCRRMAADGKRVDPEYRDVAPALEGVKYKGRWVVIYSKYDLGCALERHTSSSCLGHDYGSAVRLGRAAVLYALKR